MRRLLLLALLLAGPAGEARAGIAVLDNGNTLKVASWRLEGELVRLALEGGGEVAVPAGLVRGIVPDEVVQELANASLAAAGATDLGTLVAEAARRHGLDPALVRAVAEVESGLRPDAVSPKGAQGLMQLMPATAAALGVRDAFDAADNLDGGARHLSALIQAYGGDLRRALAAYNAGAGAVNRHGGVPPFAETRGYVAKVLQRYRPGGS